MCWRGALIGVHRVTFIANAVLGFSIQVFGILSALKISLLNYGSSGVEQISVSPSNRSSTSAKERMRRSSPHRIDGFSLMGRELAAVGAPKPWSLLQWKINDIYTSCADVFSTSRADLYRILLIK